MPTTARRKLPDVRPSITVHGIHGNFDYYVTVGFYDDERSRCKPGEVFVIIAKEGSDMRHFVGCWAQAVSIALQFGVPWEMISNKIDNTPGRPMLCAIVDSINEAIAERIRIIGLDEPAVVPAKEETSHKPIDVLG